MLCSKGHSVREDRQGNRERKQKQWNSDFSFQTFSHFLNNALVFFRNDFLAETHLPLFTVMVDSKQDEEHLNFNSYWIPYRSTKESLYLASCMLSDVLCFYGRVWSHCSYLDGHHNPEPRALSETFTYNYIQYSEKLLCKPRGSRMIWTNKSQ